jgi:hypothetical protein
MAKILVPARRLVRGFVRDFSEGDKERLMRKWDRRGIVKIECEKEGE